MRETNGKNLDFCLYNDFFQWTNFKAGFAISDKKISETKICSSGNKVLFQMVRWFMQNPRNDEETTFIEI